MPGLKKRVPSHNENVEQQQQEEQEEQEQPAQKRRDPRIHHGSDSRHH